MNNKIKVRLVGGIGNQLFGVFFGMAVNSYLKSNLYADDTLIRIGSNQKRRLEVDKLQFDPLVVSFSNGKMPKINTLFKIKFVRKMCWHLLTISKKLIKEDDFKKTNFSFEIGQTFAGYFQDWFYADLVHDLNPDLKLQIKNPGQEYLNVMSDFLKYKPICIHVRLGDYLDFPELYPKLPEHYYLESIKHLSSVRANQIWVFTEDAGKIEIHYPNLQNVSERIIDQKTGLNDLESFMLLAKSDKLIASNSTYSLWAAWFVEKSGGSVVVPYKHRNLELFQELVDSRWDRYDLYKDCIITSKKDEKSYIAKKLLFEGKFLL
jgi:hypothetical protein